MIDTADRAIFTEDHHAFRDTVRRVLGDVIEPRLDDHERDGIVEREAWRRSARPACSVLRCRRPMAGPGSISASTPSSARS